MKCAVMVKGTGPRLACQLVVARLLPQPWSGDRSVNLMKLMSRVADTRVTMVLGGEDAAASALSLDTVAGARDARLAG